MWGSMKNIFAIMVVNMLTTVRIIGVICLLPIFLNYGGVAAALLSVGCYFTDFIDGLIARKFHASTFFGSTYDGRHTATKYLLGISYKSPIIIEESRNIIFFPTNSPRQYDCCWISLRNIMDYKRKHNRSIIFFDNGKQILLNISYGSLDNQILRATRLESVMRNKKIG